MTESATLWTDTPKPLPMDPATFVARARAEGVLDAITDAGVIASMAGIDQALDQITLPKWAAQVLRAQYA